MLSDFQTGEPLALLEGSYLTTIRTGALSGVATKYLARHNAKTLCIIGTGEQAKGIAEAVFAVRAIEKSFYTIEQKKRRMHLRSIYKRDSTNLHMFTPMRMKQ